MGIFDTIVSNQTGAIATARASYITLLAAGLENADATTLAGLLTTLGFSLDQAKVHEKVYSDYTAYQSQASNLASATSNLSSVMTTSNAAFATANAAINTASFNLKTAQAAFDVASNAASQVNVIHQKWNGIIF